MREENDPKEFMHEVMEATPDGHRLISCLQCGTCGGSCPNGADMDYTPRAIFTLIAAGEKDKVLSSNTMWCCVSCYFCTARCPKQIPITELMYTLKRMAVAQDYARHGDAVALARNFTHFIERYGRSFELGIATRFYLVQKPGSLLGLGPLGVRMFRHGRLHLMPQRIRNIEQLRAILDKARELGRES